MYELNNGRPIGSRGELEALIDRVGFLPLFCNEVAGFSVEELTAPTLWWSENPETDPWLWREAIAREGRIAYGKFFGKRAGFISRDWFAAFANYRRDGYDFDALYEDGKARIRSKKIMDCFTLSEEYMSTVLKTTAGFGKGGEKNFEGIVTELQMQTYLVIKDFRKKRSKKGLEYGMSIGLLAPPEAIWGYDAVTACYSEDPEESHRRILRHAMELLPGVNEATLSRIL